MQRTSSLEGGPSTLPNRKNSDSSSATLSHPTLQQNNRYRRPSNQSVRSSGSNFSPLASTLELDPKYSTNNDEAVIDQHSPYFNPIALGEEAHWKHRRPSSISNHSFNSTGGTRRRSSGLSGPGSPQAHPALRTSSRSKILASSAALIDNVTAPLPYDYRVRSNSNGDDRSFVSESPTRPTSRSPRSKLSRLSTAPSPTVPLPASPSTSSLVGSNSGTPIDRKRRLGSLSANSVFEEPGSHIQPSDTGSTLLLETSPRISSSVTPSLLISTDGKTEASPPRMEDDRRSISSLSKPSLRSRLFGLRKGSKDNSEGQNEIERPSPAPSLPSPVMRAPGTDYSKVDGKLPSSSSSNGMLSPASAAVPRTVPMKKRREVELAEQQEDEADEKSNRAPSMVLEGSRDTDISWITSLSNVSPPTMPHLNRVESPLSLHQLHSGEGMSPASPPMQLSRTVSWPSDERKGSFVSLKSSTSTNLTGYRFENAASQARTSPVLEVTSPSFLSIDPRPSIDSPPAERSEKSASVAKLGSPALLDTDAFDSNRRMRTHGRSDSSSSSIRSSFPRISPRTAVPPPNGLAKSKQGEGNMKFHQRNSSSASLPWNSIEATGVDQRMKRRSATVSSVYSATSPPPSPSYSLARISPLPRTSSLTGRGPVILSRTSSASNSFISAASPSELPEAFVRQEDDWRGGREESLLASISAMGTSDETDTASSVRAKSEERTGDVTFTGPPLQSPGLSTLLERPAESSESSAQPKVAPPIRSRDEPKRPTKSPLRRAPNSTGALQTTPIDSVVSQANNSTRQSVVLPDLPAQNGLQRLASRSPPRQSLEDVVQLTAFALANSNTDRPSSEVMLSSEIMAVHQPTRRTEEQLPSAPESAKGLQNLTRSHQTSENPSANVSTTSLTTEEEHEMNGAPRTPKMASRRVRSLKKTKAPAIAQAFGRVSTSTNKQSPTTDPLVEEEFTITQDLSNNTPSSKRKTKKWPFTSKETNTEVEHERKASGGKASKVANTLRGKKSDAQVSRLLIRRVYDEPRLNDDSDDSEEEDENERMRIISGQSTVTTGQSPVIGSRSVSKESLARTFRTSSNPTTPIIPSAEELTPELKRLVYRRNVIRELVETEKSYSSDLAVVRDVYLARARMAVGLSSVTSLSTPLSGQSAPSLSPMLSGSPFANQSNVSLVTNKSLPRKVQRMASSELRLAPSSPVVPALTTASPSSFASSSEPSNRSSTYTVSSQTSNTSDSSFQVSNPPPLPATPPNLATLNTTNSATTLHAHSPASNASTSTFSAAKVPTGRPKMQVSTSSLSMTSGIPSSGASGDVGLTVSDVRVIFAHLEASSAFADEMASVLAISMGTFARSKRILAGDVTLDMDKEDDRLGETFLTLMPQIRKVYTDYCSRHEASMLRLQEVMATSPKANTILKECTEVARKQTNAWDLASLLIKPVQRVLKYPLLIQEIVNNTSTSHPDYSNLSRAFGEIQSVADEINQVKKRRDLAETLINGRVNKETRVVSSSGSTFKSKKKSEPSTDDGPLIPFGAEEAALREYELNQIRFQAMSENAVSFAIHCTAWSLALREHYEGQIKIMMALRRTYRLQMALEGIDGGPRLLERREATKGEERLVSAYLKILDKILVQSWSLLDRDIQSTVLPKMKQISDLFESPRLVMAKRDERQADFQRYRQSLMNGRQCERKVMEGANGFIALNAQLVEELPTFLRGVQTLFDVGVQSFARLQATHFSQVNTRIVTYWSDVAKKGEEIVASPDGSGRRTMRHVHPIRAFWDRHSVSAAWIDSLGIIREDFGLAEDSDSDSASSTPNLGTGKQFANERGNSTAFPLHDRAASSPSGLTSNSYSHSSTNARRPNSSNGLMRTLSGTFHKEQNDEIVPPLPSGASLKHTPASSVAPSLPNLVFRGGEGEEGYFVQSGPISFLDTKEIEDKKQPYDNTPNNSTRHLVDSNRASSASLTRSSSNFSSISIPPKENQRISGSDLSNMAPPKRQKMNVLYQCTAKMDSKLDVQSKGHLGWPFVNFTKGDTFKVLSSDDTGPTSLLFGRVDRSGEVGWVEKRCF